MKYKIGKYVIDSKSPLKAHEAIKMIRQYNKQRVKDAHPAVMKIASIIGNASSDNEVVKKLENAGYDVDVMGNYILTDVGNKMIVIGNKNKIGSTISDKYKDLIQGNYLISLNDSKQVKDEAFDRSTLEALISDEQAAIDAYNVAIANLEGKLSDLAIKVLQKIRDDEQRHVENLNAILANNITEKNLQDSIHDGDIVNDLKVILNSIKSNKTSEAIRLLESLIYKNS